MIINIVHKNSCSLFILIALLLLLQSCEDNPKTILGEGDDVIMIDRIMDLQLREVKKYLDFTQYLIVIRNVSNHPFYIHSTLQKDLKEDDYNYFMYVKSANDKLFFTEPDYNIILGKGKSTLLVQPDDASHEYFLVDINFKKIINNSYYLIISDDLEGKKELCRIRLREVVFEKSPFDK